MWCLRTGQRRVHVNVTAQTGQVEHQAVVDEIQGEPNHVKEQRNFADFGRLEKSQNANVDGFFFLRWRLFAEKQFSF